MKKNQMNGRRGVRRGDKRKGGNQLMETESVHSGSFLFDVFYL